MENPKIGELYWLTNKRTDARTVGTLVNEFSWSICGHAGIQPTSWVGALYHIGPELRFPTEPHPTKESEEVLDEPVYRVLVTRDASVTYALNFQLPLDEIISRCSRHGFDMKTDEREWVEADVSTYDNVERIEIINTETETLVDAWEPDQGWIGPNG